MSFEVAAVHATLGFRVEGAEQAARYTQQVTAAQQALQGAVGNSSAQVQDLSNKLKQAISDLQGFSQVPAQVNAELKALGSSIGTLANDLARATATYDQQRAKVEELSTGLRATSAEYEKLNAALQASVASGKIATDEHRKLNAAAAEAYYKQQDLAEALATEEKALEKTTQEVKELAAAQKELDDIPIGTTAKAAQIERLTGQLNKATGATALNTAATTKQAAAFKLNQTTLAGFVSAIRTGNVGSSLLAQGLQVLTSTGGLAAIALGALGIAAFGAATKLVMMAEQVRLIPPRLLEMATGLREIEGIDLTQLATQLGVISNRFESFEFTNADQVASEVASIGAALAKLKPGAGDEGQAIEAVARAIESLNVDSLRDYGVQVDELKRNLEALGAEGNTTGQRLAIIQAVSRTLASNANEVAAATDRERNSFAALKQEVSNMIATSAGVEGLGDAWAELVGALRAGLPILQSWIDLFAEFAEGGIKLFTDAITAVNEEMLIWARGLRAIDKWWASTPFGKESWPGLDKFIEDMERSLDKSDQAGTTFRRLGTDVEDLGRDATETADRFKDFRDSLSISSGIYSQLQSLGQAFANLTDGIDPGEVSNYVQTLSTGLSQIAEQGVDRTRASFDALERLMHDSFAAGILSAEELDRGLRELEANKAFAEPLIAEVERMEREFGNTETAAQRAAAKVESVSTALHNIPPNVSSNIHIGVSGPGAALLNGGFSIPSGSFSGNIPVPLGTPSAITNPTGPVGGPARGRQSSGADRALINTATNSGIASRREAFERAANERNRMFGTKPQGGGGGGGGGGGELASLADIRRLIQEINTAIGIGLRGYRIGTAGNAIPFEAGQYFSSDQSGGVNINTLLIRGVWDFADPQAKRQIIKQMEEALRGFRAEIGS